MLPRNSTDTIEAQSLDQVLLDHSPAHFDNISDITIIDDSEDYYMDDGDFFSNPNPINNGDTIPNLNKYIQKGGKEIYIYVELLKFLLTAAFNQ